MFTNHIFIYNLNMITWCIKWLFRGLKRFRFENGKFICTEKLRSTSTDVIDEYLK